MAWLATSLISVLMFELAVGAVPGEDVADGAGTLVGKGEAVGNRVSVARPTGEQAAKPLSTPNALTFNASLREILFVTDIPPKCK